MRKKVVLLLLTVSCLSFVATTADASRRHGRRDRPYIGVSVRDSRCGRGAYIQHMAADSPADIAGLDVRDIILRVNGRRTRTACRFVDVINDYRPGDRVKIEFVCGDDGGMDCIYVILGRCRGQNTHCEEREYEDEEDI